MENPKTLMEKIDAAANLVEQMNMATHDKRRSPLQKVPPKSRYILI